MATFTERARTVMSVAPAKPATPRPSVDPDGAKMKKVLAGIADLVAGKSPRDALRSLIQLRMELLKREGDLRVAGLQHLLDAEV